MPLTPQEKTPQEYQNSIYTLQLYSKLQLRLKCVSFMTVSFFKCPMLNGGMQSSYHFFRFEHYYSFKNLILNVDCV